ncbi:ubiquinol-cytochrome c reductase cytochrome c1 subunit [gamma proteobacterium HdN1]|nr:ubiquinol-cytochrome c reductase cytochrome c1 subunit [gamma proteobacterium HdN1]
MKKLIALMAALLLLPVVAFAISAELKLEPAPINLDDKVSLQRGVQLFVNNCMGCHSAKYVRYERMADDLGIPHDVALKNLVFTTDKIGDPMLAAMPHDLAKKWFGTAPPDLSLAARVRGADWVYGYLTGFYADEKRPFKFNNHVFPDVGMPHVLQHLEASVSKEEFKSQMADLTNFMVYMAEPIRAERERLGFWVLGFIIILGIPVYFLNREYWKDVH